MGRAKEKILAHKKAREEAKSVKKQAHLRGGSKVVKKSDGTAAPTRTGAEAEGENKCKAGKKSSGSTNSNNSGSGSCKPSWRNVNNNNNQQVNKVPPNLMKDSEEDLRPLTRLTIPDLICSEELKQLEEILPEFTLKDLTPMVAAVALNRYDLIKKLMRDNLVDFDYSEKLLTPMICALRMHNWEMINFLVEKGLTEWKNLKGSPILVEAVLLESWDLQEFMELYHLVKEDSVGDIRSADVGGMTLCHGLAKRGWVTVLDELLPPEPLTGESRGVLLELMDARTVQGVTPIMLAAEHGHAEVISYLINRGANFWSEDKLGFTTLCRALNYMYDAEEFTSDLTLDASCAVMIHALNSPQCLADAKNYICRRVQVFTSPVWEHHLNSMEGFCALSRASFFFYSACLTSGLEELMMTRFISRLVMSGLKYFGHLEYVGTICGIFFEFLVSAYDKPDVYDEAVRDFISEGAADFCAKVMLRSLTFPSGDNSRYGENASVSSSTEDRDSDLNVCQGEYKERNMHMAGMLPFIQILDHPHFQSWLSLHFSALKPAYFNCVLNDSPAFVFKCNLHPWQCPHLARNSVAWDNLWSKPDYIPFQDLFGSCPSPASEITSCSEMAYVSKNVSHLNLKNIN